MIKGFSLVEALVALTLGLGIMVLVVSNISESARSSKKVIHHQEKMESIFHTVEMIRSDLTKCGMRLREAARVFPLSLFQNSDYSFKVTYGIGDEALIRDCLGGENTISIVRNEFFNRGKKIMIYDPNQGVYEINEIKALHGSDLILSSPLQNDYSCKSPVIVLKEVEYKHYNEQHALKRKVNKGYFQPLIEQVTDFYVKFFPESSSVLYRIEIDRKEQVRGFIFLTHMVGK
jgi:competence protein ComGF